MTHSLAEAAGLSDGALALGCKSTQTAGGHGLKTEAAQGSGSRVHPGHLRSLVCLVADKLQGRNI